MSASDLQPVRDCLAPVRFCLTTCTPSPYGRMVDRGASGQLSGTKPGGCNRGQIRATRTFRMTTHFRTEVIGSLLRPEYLKQARKRWEAKDISTREFKQVEDRAVDEMITLQQQCGVDVI